MNLHLATENIALSVAYLRNSRAITCNMRLDGKIFSHNLLRPELISISQGSADQLMNLHLATAPVSQEVALYTSPGRC